MVALLAPTLGNIGQLVVKLFFDTQCLEKRVIGAILAESLMQSIDHGLRYGDGLLTQSAFHHETKAQLFSGELLHTDFNTRCREQKVATQRHCWVEGVRVKSKDNFAQVGFFEGLVYLLPQFNDV